MRRWLAVIALVFLAGCGGSPSPTPGGSTSPAVATAASPVASVAPAPGGTPAASATAAPPTSTRPPATPATPSAQPATPGSPTRPAATPLATPAGPGTPVTPGGVAVAVANVGNYRSSFGVLYFIGEVVNTGGQEVTNVQIAITLLGDAGQTLASGQANAIGLNVLAPGQRTVWSAPISNAPAEWREERVLPQAVAATAETTAAFAVGLTVELMTAKPAGSPATQGITVSGQVRNGGTTAARFPLVTVGCYDAAGTLLMVDSGPAQRQEIAPGATAPFEVALPNQQGLPAIYVAYAKGVAVR
jgi:hypothetical protein